ncbi:Predicted acyltransferase, contains DUF342 domain [Desulfofundulus australicus DSM 11792]|uniref:Predicted acyltransferase, contains DUF342 domain n=1 Tax=Desulfofundulus australicus DSM 11792 TaxID=1121425 RepID=A0A1M4YCV0_9FIRM|nr:hypothetical protein [Desulfofundulus australicus]SHF03557.1 Predicted acyltransferase, contains DUF342 domain [Desulfofundulus australicus DSM 11792]
MIKNWVKSERGQALVLVIGIIAVLAMVTSAALVYAKNQSLSVIRQKKQMQAYYVADAGITRALEKIKVGDYDFSDLKNLPYDEGKISDVTVDRPITGPGVYTITSTGVYPDPDKFPSAEVSKRTIQVKVEITEGIVIPPGGGIEPGAEAYFAKGIWTNKLVVNNAGKFKSSIYCTGDVDVKNSLWIGEDTQPRNIYANGSVTLGNGCKIRGNIYARGDVDLSNGDSVSETIQSYGNITLGNGNNVSGSVLTHGNIKINNGSNFNQLQANGKIVLGNGVNVNGIVKAGDDLFLNNGSKVRSSVWTMGNLSMSNGSEISGSAWVHGDYLNNGGLVRGGVFDLPSMEPINLNIPEVPPVPRPDINWYRTEAKKNPGHYFNSSTDLNLQELESGIYFIEGNLGILAHRNGGTFAGKVTIVATGDVYVPNGVSVTLNDVNNDSLLLIAGDEIILDNGSRVNAFIWASNRIFLNNAASVEGGIISPSIEARNSIEIKQTQLPVKENIIIKSWR